MTGDPCGPDDLAEVAEATPVAAPLTLLVLATTLLLRRRLIIAMALFGGAVAGVAVLVRGPRYTVTTTFMPQARSNGTGLASVAAQLGVSVPSEGADQSPSFYVDLMVSRAILGAVVDSVILTPEGPRKLADILEIRPAPPALRRDLAIARLRDAVDDGFSQRTGVVRLAVTMRSASTAQAVAEQIIREVTRFNIDKRQGRAASERRFTEQRLEQANVDLRAAESRQQDFLSRNRDYHAPQLMFEYERLEREVNLRQQLYASLAQAYDRAKIDEVRDTPVFTQIEKPELPSRPDPRGMGRWITVGALLGLFGGAILALFLEYLASNEGNPDIRRAFSEARGAAVADLRRPWRLLRRRPLPPPNTITT